MIKRRLTAGAVLAALIVAGCGGGGGGGGTLSKDEFVSKADDICGKAAAEVKKLGTPNTPDKIAEVMPKLSSTFGKMLDDLEALNEPAAVKADFAKLIAAGRKIQETTGKLAGAAKDKNVAELTQLQTDFTKASTDAASAAQKIGFKNCGVS
jgi:hypothetical protein